MEKVKTLVTLFLLALLLSGCYRQTTVILPQGQTLPFSDDIASETISSTTAESTLPSSAETTTVQPSHTPKQTTPKESDNTPKETKPASTIPVQSQPHTETTSPIATNPPVETTVPAESTASTETEPPAKPFEHPVYNISSHSIGSYERTMQEELNRHRSDAGLSPLSMNKKLSALAAIRAYECSKEFSHTRPDGRSWDSVLADYGASAYTENILYASSGTGAALLIDTCMGSTNHSQKILHSDYRSVGIGIFDTGRYIFVVMIFS